MKKSVWLPLSFVFLWSLCGPAGAAPNAEAPTVAMTVATAATTVDPGQDRALPTTAAAVPMARSLAPEAAAPETGWRERLALLGAAVLALLFILRRQLAQRMGETGTRSPDRRLVPPSPSWIAPTRSGFLLSQFDNLPAPDDDTFEITPAPAEAVGEAAPRRKRSVASRRAPTAGRRKPRARAEAP